MTGFLHILRRFWADESGTTLVELAFVIPLFLLLFSGLYMFVLPYIGRRRADR